MSRLSPLSLLNRRDGKTESFHVILLPPSDCKDCYSQYLTSKIMDESESRRIECMAKDCNVIVDERTVELVVEPNVLQRCVQQRSRSSVSTGTESDLKKTFNPVKTGTELC